MYITYIIVFLHAIFFENKSPLIVKKVAKCSFILRAHSDRCRPPFRYVTE